MSGCFSTDRGLEPPEKSIYFPVGLAVSPGGTALYVASSDFDLQFNAGWVQLYDLAALREALRPLTSGPTDDAPTLCARAGLAVNGSELLQPGPCAALDPSPMVRSVAKTGAFATDLLFVCRPSPVTGVGRCRGPADTNGARLFVPVRGDPSVTFFEVDDDRGGSQSFRFECGQNLNSGRCDDGHRMGVDPDENTRGLAMPTEPFGLAAADTTEALVVTHQAWGAMSLFTERLGSQSSLFDVKPALQFVLDGLPAAATGIAAMPVPAIVHELGYDANYQPGFLVAYRGAAEVDVVRFFSDLYASPARPFLVRTAAYAITANAGGSDSRSIAIDASESSPRMVCEAGCYAQKEFPPGDSRNDCLMRCATVPLAIYIANRAPASLVIGETWNPWPTVSAEALRIYDSVPLSYGPSRVVVGTIRDRQGMARTRVFVVCFDSRLIYVFDPEAGRVENAIRTGRGPHALVLDPIEPIAYVAHFTDSYIGVVDLDEAHSDTFETMVAAVGVPTAPRETK